MRIDIVAVVVAATALASLTSCVDMMVPDYNNPSVDQINQNPTEAGIAAAAQGLLRGTRANLPVMASTLGMFGREGWLMATTGGGLSSAVRDPLVGSGGAGAGLWAAPYQNIRNANLLLDVTDKATVLSEAQKEAVRGFTKTIMAYDFLMIVVTRDRFGAPIAIPGDPNAEPAPIAPKTEVYAHVKRLLDEGRAHLVAAGSTAFPFRLTSGLTSFATPGRFIEVNRAIRARANIYTNDWSAALQDIQESFMTLTRPLDYGAYHVFTDRSGDLANPLAALDRYYAHNRIRDGAQLREDGTRDLRAQRKLVQVTPITVLGNTSNVQFTMYTAAGSPMPWLRNEELILLRAEARLGLGDRAGALDDINFIRANSGGLALLPTGFAGDLLEELLYNKLMSLAWEWGHAWIDARHYNRLMQLPVGAGDPRVFDVLPFPTAECLPRDPQPAGCATLDGLR